VPWGCFVEVPFSEDGDTPEKDIGKVGIFLQEHLKWFGSTEKNNT